MRKWAVVIAVAIPFAALAGAIVHFRPDRAIRLATGFVAHNVCSKTFVSGLDPQAAFTEFSDRAGIRRLRYALRFQMDAPPGPSMLRRSDCSAAVRRSTTGSDASSSSDRKSLIS